MKRLTALVTGALVAAGLTVAPATEAAADSPPVAVGGSGWTITLAIPDLQWTSLGTCQNGGGLQGRLTVVVQGVSVSEWSIWGDITYKADARPATYIYGWGEGVGTFSESSAFTMCPERDRNGVYRVVGEVQVSLDPSDTDIWLPPVPFETSFTLSPMQTTTTLAPPTVVGTLTTFSGRVLAASPVPSVGQIPPDPAGQVAIETLTDQTWTRIGFGNPDASGFFALPVATVLPPGSQYKAHFLGTTTCAESFSAIQVVPTPPVVQPTPTVKVKAVSGRSKLKVDVNPNMGRKYWTFQVQRKNNRDGTWKPLKTYKTLGSAEKRTINLPKGTYKVFVNPKFGYQGATSLEVVLKR